MRPFFRDLEQTFCPRKRSNGTVLRKAQGERVGGTAKHGSGDHTHRLPGERQDDAHQPRPQGAARPAHRRDRERARRGGRGQRHPAERDRRADHRDEQRLRVLHRARGPYPHPWRVERAARLGQAQVRPRHHRDHRNGGPGAGRAELLHRREDRQLLSPGQRHHRGGREARAQAARRVPRGPGAGRLRRPHSHVENRPRFGSRPGEAQEAPRENESARADQEYAFRQYAARGRSRHPRLQPERDPRARPGSPGIPRARARRARQLLRVPLGPALRFREARGIPLRSRADLRPGHAALQGDPVHEGQRASGRVPGRAHADGRRSRPRLGEGREALEHHGLHRQESAAGPFYQGVGTMFGGKAVKKPAAKTTKPAEEKPAKRNGLTEAELLRAPASQYMSAEQLAFFRERLLQTQKELLENANLTSEHLREHDPTDQATIEEEYALELRARDRERKLLKKIDEALRRIDDGSYGYCEETGEPIGIPRLLARPTATLSIEAQARREQKQKLYGE